MAKTSERVTPESASDNLEDYLIYLMHKKTYEFTQPWVSGKEVLDFGCGDGYGDSLLAAQARHVTAVDIAGETVREAEAKYRAQNLSFQVIKELEEEKLPFSDASFDVILSFQVIEHVPDVALYLKEMHRLLKAGGTFILSTPNAAIRLLPFQNPWNKFHLREYTADSLQRVLSGIFAHVDLSGLTLEEPWLSRERRRTDRNKWLLWPVTNKLVPSALRLKLLHGIWDVCHKQAGHKEDGRRAGDVTHIPDAIVTQADIGRCPSLIGVCTKPQEAV